jgi:hypothetical protein
MNIKEYAVAAQLMEQIEKEQLAAQKHLHNIARLRAELLKAVEGGGSRVSESLLEVSPAKPVEVAKTVPHLKVRMAAQPGKKRSRGASATKTPPAANGHKNGGSPPEPLGDLVRKIIIKAGKPLTAKEIEDGLRKINYTNSSPDTYKTVGVRLYKLDKKGVVKAGEGKFFLTDEWIKKLEEEKEARRQTRAAAREAKVDGKTVEGETAGKE